jgi:hypothetical protein
MYLSTSAAVTARSIARLHGKIRRGHMLRNSGWLERFRAKWSPVRVKKTRQDEKSEFGSDSIRTNTALRAGLAAAALSILAALSLHAGSAQAAVVYCTTAGVPRGCVVRATPVAAVAVVTPRVGVVGVGARGVGVRRGTAWNRGGPVNRIGRR